MTEDEPRERIRDAALRQFALLGFKGATVRGIAADAGVSPGLVQHHFPTKDALREECDAYVFAALRGLRDRGPADADLVANAHEVLALIVPYVATAMAGDTPTAARWFDELAEGHREALTNGERGTFLPEGEDVQAIVAVHTAMELGLAILNRHLYRRLGAEPNDPAADVRIARARLYLATRRTVGEELEKHVREGLERFEHGEGSDR
ncbi:helix-turn-helix domain-containing protein [Streptosporangium longisporum]|uniref:TetR/AcrR family transcriptional regulator n=1 Tax=Streptosporangium longisporum TaxID=46187 RepID=A0ABP6KEC6_9ACTN